MQLLDRPGVEIPFPLEEARGVSHSVGYLCEWCRNRPNPFTGRRPKTPATGMRFSWRLRTWLAACERHMLEAPAGEWRRLDQLDG